jgi:hypothetical protein
VTLSASNRMGAIYPLMDPLLSSEFVSSFCPPMLELLCTIRHSTAPESPDGIHGQIVGLFAPVLRPSKGYGQDLLVKLAPQGLDLDPIGNCPLTVRPLGGRICGCRHHRPINKAHRHRSLRQEGNGEPQYIAMNCGVSLAVCIQVT